jgi:hypothetical protein
VHKAEAIANGLHNVEAAGRWSNRAIRQAAKKFTGSRKLVDLDGALGYKGIVNGEMRQVRLATYKHNTGEITANFEFNVRGLNPKGNHNYLNVHVRVK